MKTSQVFLLGFILSCFISSIAAQDNCQRDTIRVVGQGQVRVDPDMATIYVSVQQEGTTSQLAIDKVNNKITAIMQALLSNNVTKDDVTWSYFSIYPRYDYSNGTSTIVGEIAYVSLTIVIKGVNFNNKKIADVIDAVAAQGISSLYGITYDLSNPDAGKLLATSRAFNNARKQAVEYGMLTGRKLGQVLIIDETNHQYYPYRATGELGLRVLLYQTNSSTSNNQSNSAVIPIGQIVIIVKVIVVYALY